MRRRLFTVASLLSLLLCVAMAALCVMSFAFEYKCLIHLRGYEIGVYDGRIGRFPYMAVRLPRTGSPLGSSAWVITPVKNRDGMSVWKVCVLSALLPVIWILRKPRPLVPGHCHLCSYDLTGNTSGVCPECGTAVPGKAESVKILASKPGKKK